MIKSNLKANNLLKLQTQASIQLKKQSTNVSPGLSKQVTQRDGASNQEDVLSIFNTKIQKDQQIAYFVPIDDIYHQEKKKVDEQLEFLSHKMITNPEKYEMMVKRNLNSFVEEEKLHEQRQLSTMIKKQNQNMSRHKEELKKLKEIQDKYNIIVKENDRLPYQERIQRDCNIKNYFFEYKKNRMLKLQEDKDCENYGVEPIHLQIQKQEERRIFKEKRRRLRQKAVDRGDIEGAEKYYSTDEDRKQTEEEVEVFMTKEQKLQNWLQKNKRQKQRQSMKKAVLLKNIEIKQIKEKSLEQSPQNKQEMLVQLESKSFDNRPNTVKHDSFTLKLQKTNQLQKVSEVIKQLSKPQTSNQNSKRQQANHNGSVSFDLNSIKNHDFNSVNEDKTFISNMRFGSQQQKLTLQNSSAQQSTRPSINLKSKFTSIKQNTIINFNDSTYATSINIPDSPKDYNAAMLTLSTTRDNQQHLRFILKTQGSIRKNNPLSKSLNVTTKHTRMTSFDMNTLQKETTNMTLDQQENISHQKINLNNTMIGIKDSIGALKSQVSSFRPIKFFQKRRQQSIDYQNKSRDSSRNDDIRNETQVYNMKFKGKTPTLQDDQIKQLIHQYPTNYVNVRDYIKTKKVLSSPTHLNEMLLGVDLSKPQVALNELKRRQSVVYSKKPSQSNITQQSEDFTQQSFDKTQELTKSVQRPRNLNKNGFNSEQPPKQLNSAMLKVLINEGEKRDQRKKLFKIMHLCKKVETQWPKERNDTEYKQLLEQIKEQEFNNVIDQVRDIDFADPSIIPVLYQYKASDFNDNVRLAKEVAIEYKSGKLDPKMAMQNERTTKQMLKRGMMIC
eukprot:403362900